jgi:16S rRNA processing protein RimM
VPIEQRAKLSDGKFFVSDLVGCDVWEKGAETSLGSVRDVVFTGGAAPLLAVDTKGGEVLLPLAEEFCVRIDVKAKRIDVILPDGLLDLNRR